MPIAGATPIAGAMPVAGTMSTSVASVTPMIAGAMTMIASAVPVVSAAPIADTPIGGARIADDNLRLTMHQEGPQLVLVHGEREK